MEEAEISPTSKAVIIFSTLQVETPGASVPKYVIK